MPRKSLTATPGKSARSTKPNLVIRREYAPDPDAMLNAAAALLRVPMPLSAERTAADKQEGAA